MIAEIGLFALVLAFVLALVQSVVPLIGARRGDVTLMRIGERHGAGAIRFHRRWRSRR